MRSGSSGVLIPGAATIRRSEKQYLKKKTVKQIGKEILELQKSI
jgi:hypothetical protein